MKKALRKAIMTKSRLKSIYLKNQNTTNWNNYKSQRNFCTNLLRKTKRDYFRNLNIRELNDNKKFWKRIKPFFADKGLANNSIVLKENGHLITDTQELPNLFNTYYINLINTLQLKISHTKFKSLSEILSFYKNHDSISKIKAGNNLQQQFHFKEVSSNEVKKIIKSLNTKKSALSSCISVSILINSIDTYLSILTDIINDSIKNGVFPDELKLAEVIPLFKKADPFDKSNYRPVSLLSHMSKVFERIIYNQINENIEPLLSNLLTGFRKNHNTTFFIKNAKKF